MTFKATFSFANFQANNPSAPLPGIKLDVMQTELSSELQTQAAKIEGLLRADGRLRNGVVTIDSISDQLKTLLGPRGGVTTYDLDPAAFASDEQGAAGVAQDLIMTPASTKKAVDSLRSIAQQDRAKKGEGGGVMTAELTKEAIDAQRPLADVSSFKPSDAHKTLTVSAGEGLVNALRKVIAVKVQFAFGNVATGASVCVPVEVEGVEEHDRVLIAPPAEHPLGVLLFGHIATPGKVTFAAFNGTGSPVTIPEVKYAVTLVRF
ncbi:hypothetical protein [Polycladidibacter hongkongensis]|uniref:hypothetical protein n=1 Tax=Polycladidibacter hongkongensis TaxID=1647556 RepID=UPI00082E5153|nr:hypothetical protein [Pseudovibrio hongkongensis]